MPRAAVDNAIVEERLFGVRVVRHFDVSKKSRTSAAGRLGHVRIWDASGERREVKGRLPMCASDQL